MKTHEHPPTIDETFDWNTAYTGEAADYQPPNALILDAVAGLPAGRALDVGCGAGGLMVALAKRGWRVTGVDIAETAIAAARAVLADGGVDAHLEVADARDWRPAGHFELLANSFALPFGVQARSRVFEMFRDALAPGGTVILEDFDSSMASSSFLAGTDLVTIEELLEAFSGFEIIRAEVIDTPVHHHESDNGLEQAESWTAAMFHARKPA